MTVLPCSGDSLLASVVADEESCTHHIGSLVDNLSAVLWSLLILPLHW